MEDGWTKAMVEVEGGEPMQGFIRQADGLSLVYWPDGEPFGYKKSSGWIAVRKGKRVETFFVAGRKADPSDPPVWGVGPVR